ncbi:hypothetical protein, partial [Pseudomonas aeruginosa]
AGSSELTPLRKMPGEPYPVIPSKPSLLNQLDAVLKEVAENVGAVSEKAQLIFNEENADNVRKSLANIERITEIIADKGQTIDSSLNNLDVFVANMAKTSKQFPQLIKDLKTGISKFKSLADNMSAAGKDVSKTMIAG